MSEPIHLSAPDLSTAWLATTLAVNAAGKAAFHTVTRIGDAGKAEEPRIRNAADCLLTEAELQPVSTVANTIFPAAIAKQNSDPVELAARYRDLVPQLKRLDSNNSKGTYFQRLVDYPAADGRSVNQLARIINTLSRERSGRGPKRARYEAMLAVPDVDGTVPVVVPARDTSAMAFPCLSLLSFQLDGSQLHAVAHYRSQYLVQRGYGNYLGISRLLTYIADQTGVSPGTLTVVVGLAHVDHLRKDLAASLRMLADDLGVTSWNQAWELW
ncbi:thymidylate synthase [Nocardia sp. 2YAB30]|uniref:thymidylate synthase n=1 Tax=unclassified Nocardia TaxID=2637762 RepID=UPI003F992891